MITKHLLLIYLCLVVLIINGCFISVADSDDLAVTMQAEGYPLVVTNASTNVEEITVTLNGYLVDDAGGLCTCGFDYDTNSGVLYASEIWNVAGKNSGEEYSCNIIVTEGTLYYFRAKANNINGTTYGSELTFLTKPDPPSNFDATAYNKITQINLTWTKGDGADVTIVVRKQDSYPVDIGDGTIVYNGTGNNYDDIGVTAGNRYHYRAWSYVTAGGWIKYSDTYDEDNAIALTPTEFDIRSISLIDSTVTDLIISCIVENRGAVASDITVVWTLVRVDTGATLDSGSDTFQVMGTSDYMHFVYPSTSYVGSVTITFSGANASASRTFSTQQPPTGAGGAFPPAPVPPEEVPIVPPAVPPIAGFEMLVILTIPLLMLAVFLFLIIFYKRRKEEKKKRKPMRRPRPARAVYYRYH